jgi:hypothetical protein
LRLHPHQALDHGRRREPLALQQELACERRAVQLAQRQDPFADAGILPPRVASGAVLRL